MARTPAEYEKEQEILKEELKTQKYVIILGVSKDNRLAPALVGPGGVLVTSLLAEYTVNDIDNYTNANITYIGMEDKDGRWIVVKIDSSTGIVVRYASQKNNPSITDYTTAWNNRTTLNYDYLKNVI